MPTLEERVAALEGQLTSITTPSHAELVNRMSTLLTAWQGREDEQRAWQAGVGNGGPNGDGKYPLTDPEGTTRLVSCPARIAADATLMPSLTFTASVTLNASHSGKRIRMNNTGPATVTFANGLPEGFNVLVCRVGTAVVNIAAASGAVMQQDQSLTRLRARWSIATVICDALVAGNSTFIAQGSMVQV